MPGLAPAQNVVVPNALANVEGNLNNGAPFNISDFGRTSQRVQQVYASSQFSSFGGPALITAISFRTDITFGSAFSTTLPSMQINLSTTSALPDGLSSTFASNVGSDDSMVYNGALTLSSTNTGGPPHNFDIVITLQTPFLYDPALGNLLMDVRNFGAGTTTQFDAENTLGDSVSRLYSVPPDSVNDATGNTDTLGLVTQFTFAVPEPTTWALIGVGTLGAGVVAWRKRQLAIKASMAQLRV
ncbi:MAG TPA: PEP-CTERM sorting domain-containing protein [Gemmatales bacterium]|nr:PEP-CTERM sorting domain-containing protein [Gemmatales bacterium]